MAAPEAQADGVPGEKRRDALTAIAEAGGVPPTVALLGTGTVQARENAAGALWHLALEPSNTFLIAKHNGIAALVTLLDDATEKAYRYAQSAMLTLRRFTHDFTCRGVVRRDAMRRDATRDGHVTRPDVT